jgi:hypothetical protein
VSDPTKTALLLDQLNAFVEMAKRCNWYSETQVINTIRHIEFIAMGQRHGVVASALALMLMHELQSLRDHVAPRRPA